MECPIDMERKGCESTICWTYVAIFNFDLTYGLDLEFSTSNFEIAVAREWEGRLTWNERDMSGCGVIPTFWPCSMTLTLDFQGQTLKMLYLRNERANWHGTKGIWVHRMLDSHCDLEFWPLPWPWPSIFKVNFFNTWIPGTGGPINMRRKGYEWIGCSTNCVTFSYDFDHGFWRSKFKKLYHSNKRVDWHGTKRMWVDRMLDPSCDFKLWLHPWPWLWIFKVKYLIAIF